MVIAFFGQRAWKGWRVDEKLNNKRRCRTDLETNVINNPKKDGMLTSEMYSICVACLIYNSPCPWAGKNKPLNEKKKK